GSMLWIWVVDGRRIVALERATGRFVKETAILGEQEKILRGEGAFFVVSNIASGRQQITTVRLKDGNVSTLDLAASRREAATIWQEDQVPTPNIQAACTDFLPSGEGLLRADIRLVEKKVVERAAMRANDDKALDELEKSTNGASSSDAVKLAQVLANDAQRDLTGGKERIDESTYEVTLRRVAGAPVAEWKGRVQGRPELFASASLTLLSAGNQLLAFDLSNKKLWDTKLVQPVRSREHSEPAPYLEHADRLYFADQAFLTAFERATGRVLWRLPSVGITALQIDEAGKLYVSSANATADSLLYSQESRLSDVTPPVTIKLDPRNGKILWKAEKYEECYVSGGSIYASRSVRNMQDVTNAVFDPKKAVDTRYTLYKLDAGNGKAQWGWFQNRRPLHVLSRGRTVILLFEKELQVIKSIAL
ncbi:MAG: PQQ-binding-like beta-propeller repeat protein, partial [Verrucomicrobiota bacterium]